MKKLLLSLISITLLTSTFAGGLLTNTNRSAHFLRNPARGASTEIDAVYTNPAGLSELCGCGLQLSINNQSAFQERTISTKFAPFAGFGASETKVYNSKITSPFIPSIMAAYKMNNWVFSGSFAIGGGGGTAKFDTGLPSFESMVAMIPVGLNAGGIPTTKYSTESSMEGATAIYTGQVGATYSICKNIAVYGGLSINMASNSYVGYMRDIKINPNMVGIHPVLGQKYKGDMVSAKEFFTDLGQAENAAKASDLNLDCDQSGWGVAPVLGLNLNFNKLNIGLKYEFKTALDVENKVNDGKNAGGMFPDGAKTPNDIPALFTVGAKYDIIPALTVSAGYHHFFDSKAEMAEMTDPTSGNKVGKQNFIDGGMDEFLGGIEWRINKRFLISSGVQFSRTAVTELYQTDLSHSLNSYSVGMGGAVNITSKIRLNLAYFFTKYEDGEKVSAKYGGSPISGTDSFSRTNNVFGIGLDFKF